MRIGLVVQRYGTDIIGGAEAHARALARHLRTDLNWEVEVFTTTARDYTTWANAFSAGTDIIDGIRVHRFPVAHKRSRFFPLIRRLAPPLAKACTRIKALKAWGVNIERCFYDMQGPVVPSLLEALEKRAAEFDRMLFFTYLYYPTVHGLPRLSIKTALVPTLHDEPPLYFETSKKLLQDASVIFVNSASELALLERIAPQTRTKAHIVGIGLDFSNDDSDRPSLRPAPSEAYVLYLGRLSRGKGVDRLITYFEHFAAQYHDSKLKLYLAGGRDPGFRDGCDSPHVKDLGFVDDVTKRALIEGARCVVNASPLESLSLVALEAAYLQRPLILSEECSVFRHYAKVLPSVFTFTDTISFTAALQDVLTTDWQSPAPRQRLIQAKEWVDEHYSWKKVIADYARYL